MSDWSDNAQRAGREIERLTAERDDARAEVVDLRGVLDMYTAAALKSVTGMMTERDEALAEVERYRSGSYARIKVKTRLQTERYEARGQVAELRNRLNAAGGEIRRLTQAAVLAGLDSRDQTSPNIEEMRPELTDEFAIIANLRAWIEAH